MFFGLLLLAIAFPFSHKTHAPLKLDCVACHAGAKAGEHAEYPATAACLRCHGDNARLSALPKTETIEPERSVYVLAEFAFFSHARHAAVKGGCHTCHGDVWQMDQVKQVLPMTMKACIGCHRTSHAPTACNKCHELGQ